MKITIDGYVHDSKALPELVNGVIKSDKKITIGKLLAEDGAYDRNNIFKYLGDNEILPSIKVRKNSKIRWKRGKHYKKSSSVDPEK